MNKSTKIFLSIIILLLNIIIGLLFENIGLGVSVGIGCVLGVIIIPEISKIIKIKN